MTSIKTMPLLHLDRKLVDANQRLAVSQSAQKGRDDFQTLRKGWHDDKMKQLLQETTTAELRQGIDTWLVDYQSLLKTGAGPELPIAQQDNVPLDTVDIAKAVIDRFSKQLSELQIKPQSNEEDPFPLVVTIGRMEFKLSRTDSIFDLQAVSQRGPATAVSAYIRGNQSMKELEPLLVSFYAPIHVCSLTSGDSNYLKHIMTFVRANATDAVVWLTLTSITLSSESEIAQPMLRVRTSNGLHITMDVHLSLRNCAAGQSR